MTGRRRRKKYMWISLVSSDMVYRDHIEKALLARTRKVETAFYPSKIPVYRVPAEEREKFDIWIFIEGTENLLYDRHLEITTGGQSVGYVFHKHCDLEYLITGGFTTLKRKVVLEEKQEAPRRRRRRKKAA